MLTLLNVWMTASSALTPSHGSADAWAALPVNSKPTRTMPSRSWWAVQRSQPWTIIAASTPSKMPPRISFTLPPPPSSAGVPMTWIRPLGSRSRTAARPTPAPAPAAAITLWPHAWPMPGKASYSHMMAMVGLPTERPVHQVFKEHLARGHDTKHRDALLRRLREHEGVDHVG